MKVAIVGTQGSGKSTLFSALTGLDIQFGGKNNIGTIKVPDKRVDELSAIFEPKKTTYADICFEDVGRLNKEGLNKLRNFEVIVFVVNAFSSDDPLSELKEIDLEFGMEDLDLVEKRITRLKKEDPKSSEIKYLEKCKDIFEAEKRLGDEEFTPDELKLIEFYRFFSSKTCLVVLNQDEGKISDENSTPADLQSYVDARGYSVVRLCATLEKEISELDQEEQLDFLKDYNLTASARDVLIRKAYELLGLISFFTVGKDEVKAWTINRDLNVRKAAGKIHSDLERGFIRAEVIGYDTFMEFKDINKAKDKGEYRVEGKDYVVKDGDIINIRFNV